VSIEISTRVWKQSRQKGTHKLFLLCLADHANGDGYCYPGIERIAEWCSVNERQGRRISADLQADGEIMVKVGGGRYGTNEYIITAGMDSEELEKTVAKYFKVGKKDAYEMVQELLKKQHDATNKNPVLEDTPVIADQNPVMQDTNPVLEDTRTVINRQESSTYVPPETEIPEFSHPAVKKIETFIHSLGMEERKEIVALANSSDPITFESAFSAFHAKVFEGKFHASWRTLKSFWTRENDTAKLRATPPRARIPGTRPNLPQQPRTILQD
jgi:hypothetical protein